jgi:hypothetical protein
MGNGVGKGGKAAHLHYKAIIILILSNCSLNRFLSIALHVSVVINFMPVQLFIFYVTSKGLLVR